MKKNISLFSIFSLIIVLAIFIKIFSLIYPKEKQITITQFSNDITAEDNMCIGLNYHRIRKPTIWNKFLNVITNSTELSVYSIYDTEFEQQIIQLKESDAYFATLDEVITFKETGKFPDKCVWVSFDDVDNTVYENAFPILKKHNIPFTLFIIVNQVGITDFSNLHLANWDALRDMRDSGLASFGSHTYDMHYYEHETNSAEFLLPENYEDFADDIKLSKEILDKELNIDIKTLAYPFGSANDEIITIVENSGFSSAYLLNNTSISKESNNFAQGRYLIDMTTFNKVILPLLNGQ